MRKRRTPPSIPSLWSCTANAAFIQLINGQPLDKISEGHPEIVTEGGVMSPHLNPVRHAGTHILSIFFPLTQLHSSLDVFS